MPTPLDTSPTSTAMDDVLIVGAGASGAAAAWKLATAGFKVTCLEQGTWVNPADTPSLRPDWEVARQTTHHPNPNVRQGPADYPVDDRDAAIKPFLYNAVGGSTILWGAHFPRFRPSDFKVRTIDGVADDWPLTYEDLAPHYAENDHMMGVSGLSGDPGNPPREARQMPPVPPGKAALRMAQAFDRLGWHWWPTDVAINTRPYGDNRGACNNCGPCDLGCPHGARSATDVTYWPQALKAGVTLITNARAFEVETDAQGRATGVAYYDAQGIAQRRRAHVVALAANGLGTPRLLLLSRSKRFPNGLANDTDLVGRRLMHHPTGMVSGTFAEPMDGWRGPFAVSILSQQFYETDPSRGFMRGYQMQLIRSDGPVGTAVGGYLPRVPWGPGHHARFRQVFGHTASLTVTTEDLPRLENRVTLSDTLKDANGIPAPKMTYSLDDNTRAMIRHGIASATQAFTEAGATDITPQDLVVNAGFHLMGTACMGSDPATSVVDANSRAHTCPNLLILDGSVFTTAAALNPTSTIQALALRAAAALIRDRATIGVAA
jgi:choline dehydrogenase-like flavoprotein